MARGYNEEIDVDMTPGGRVAVCHSSQYDVNRKIRINLYKEKSTAFLGNNAQVKLSVRKTDGTVISTNDSDVISIKYDEPSVGGRWYYILLCTTQQMTACVGNNLCEIIVTETEDEITSVIGSANFTLQVEKDPLDGGVESASVISDLQEQVNEAVVAALEITELNDIGDVVITNPHVGDILVRDINGKWVNIPQAQYEEITVPANTTSFTVTFSNMSNRKRIYVFRDSYDSAPPTSVIDSYNSSTNELSITVTFEAEQSMSNWLVGVD